MSQASQGVAAELGGDSQLPSEVDPVTLEILRGLLKSTAEEMGLNLIRTAYSHSIKERRDIATAVFDSNGRMVAQAEHIPLLLTGLYPIAEVAASRQLRRGDVLIANDPWNGGGSHLPDIALLAPVFGASTLLGFVACIAHHADVGGAVAGSSSVEFSEVYMEGLRLPPLLLVRESKVDDDVLELITANCRLGEERQRDLRAQIGALKLGERRLSSIAQSFGEETVSAVMDVLISRGRERMRRRIEQVPDGKYSATDKLDHHTDQSPAELRVEITVVDSECIVDFSGTSPQVPRAINMVMNATQGSVYFAFVSLLAPFEETSHGTFLPIQIVAPEGSLVNAVAPAAVSGRAQTCPRVVDLIFMALAPALPDRVIANSNVGPALKISGHQHSTGDTFIISEVIGGGGGARRTRDGLDGSQMYITNTTNMPVEFLESEFPVVIERLGLAEASGGMGRHRGGLGISKSFRVDVPEGWSAECTCIVDRHLTPPKGLFGGEPGSPGQLLVRRTDGSEEEIHPSKSRVSLQQGDVVTLTTSGGGGYGPPDERPREAKGRDLHYGYRGKWVTSDE